MEDIENENYTANCLDVDINSIPAIKTYHRQVSLPCYGRGKKMCDIQVPKMPSFFLRGDQKSSGAKVKTKCGRGRGKGHRAFLKGTNESPGSLQEYAKSLSDNGSVGSYRSSNDSGSYKESGDPCGKLLDGYKSDRSDPQDDIPVSSSPRLTNFSSSPKQPYSVSSVPGKLGSDSPLPHSANIPDSPPLRNLEGWRILPPGVCHLEGIPQDMDMEVLKELFSSYGTINDWEEKRTADSISLRIKLNDNEICDSIEANIDKSDFSGTGSPVRCKHLRL